MSTERNGAHQEHDQDQPRGQAGRGEHDHQPRDQAGRDEHQAGRKVGNLVIVAYLIVAGLVVRAVVASLLRL